MQISKVIGIQNIVFTYIVDDVSLYITQCIFGDIEGYLDTNHALSIIVGINTHLDGA